MIFYPDKKSCDYEIESENIFEINKEEKENVERWITY